MTDPRTREYLRQLAKTVECAEEICQCSHCSVERLKKQITADDKDGVLQYLGTKMFGGTDGGRKGRNYPSGFTTELCKDPIFWKS